MLPLVLRRVAACSLSLALLVVAGCGQPAGPADAPAAPAFAALRTTSAEQRLVLTGHVIHTEGVREIRESNTLSWDTTERYHVMHVHGWDRAGEAPVLVRIHTPDSVPIDGGWGIGGGGRAMTIQAVRDADGKYRATRGERQPAGEGSRSLTFDGEVLAIGEAPGFWSGTMVAFQVVTYRVVKVVKGESVGDRISISHIILHAKGDWRIDEKAASLNPKEFAPGKVLRIGATYHGTDQGKRSPFRGLWIPDSVDRVPK